MKKLKWLEQRELNGFSPGFQYDLIVTEEEVNKIRHTNTLIGHEGCKPLFS